MKNSKVIISGLKKFYVLEKFQVAYYKSQLSAPQDKYYRTAFEKMVEIESGHVDYFAQKLKETGTELPEVTSSLFEIASKILGESVELTGQYNTCKLGIALENEAIKMYKTLIEEARDQEELYKALIGNLIDEEFHTFWMENYAKRLNQEKYKH